MRVCASRPAFRCGGNCLVLTGCNAAEGCDDTDVPAEPRAAMNGFFTQLFALTEGAEPAAGSAPALLADLRRFLAAILIQGDGALAALAAVPEADPETNAAAAAGIALAAERSARQRAAAFRAARLSRRAGRAGPPGGGVRPVRRCRLRADRVRHLRDAAAVAAGVPARFPRRRPSRDIVAAAARDGGGCGPAGGRHSGGDGVAARRAARARGARLCGAAGGGRPARARRGRDAGGRRRADPRRARRHLAADGGARAGARCDRRAGRERCRAYPARRTGRRIRRHGDGPRPDRPDRLRQRSVVRDGGRWSAAHRLGHRLPVRGGGAALGDRRQPLAPCRFRRRLRRDDSALGAADDRRPARCELRRGAWRQRRDQARRRRARHAGRGERHHRMAGPEPGRGCAGDRVPCPPRRCRRPAGCGALAAGAKQRRVRRRDRPALRQPARRGRCRGVGGGTAAQPLGSAARLDRGRRSASTARSTR